MTAPTAHLSPARVPLELAGLRVVRRNARDLVRRDGPAGLLPVIVVAAILVAGVVVGVLLEQVVLGQSAFKLADLRTRLAAAETRHEELLLEAAKLESPDRIESVARYSLGMVEPHQVGYIVADVRPGRATRRAGGARAARLTRSAALAAGVGAVERSP